MDGLASLEGSGTPLGDSGGGEAVRQRSERAGVLRAVPMKAAEAPSWSDREAKAGLALRSTE
jgi:hypothetical protein